MIIFTKMIYNIKFDFNYNYSNQTNFNFKQQNLSLNYSIIFKTPKPSLKAKKQNVKLVSVGHHHLCYIDSHNKLYYEGSNNYDECSILK